jgi:transposase
VVDVPAKLSARARVFSTGQGRKTDATDAHSIAVVAARTTTLRPVTREDELMALRLLADRREELANARIQAVSRLHRLLPGLIPGGAPRLLSAAQARALLATVRPREIAGRTRRQIAAELLAEIVVLDRKLKDSDKALRQAVAATGTALMDLHGLGPVGAARVLADVADVARFPTRAHFASWNGTAPIDASSGEQIRHRLSGAGNRRINRVLHIMAIVSCATTQKAEPTSGAKSPPERRRWKPCGASNGGCPTCSTASSPPRPRQPPQPSRHPPAQWKRAREDTWGRLRNPARPASTP